MIKNNNNKKCEESGVAEQGLSYDEGDVSATIVVVVVILALT
jgi:hypothetical protein